MKIYIVHQATVVTIWVEMLVDLPDDMINGVAKIATSYSDWRTDTSSLTSFGDPSIPIDPFGTGVQSRVARARLIVPRSLSVMEFKLVRRRTDWDGAIEWLELGHHLYGGARDLARGGNIRIKLSQLIHEAEYQESSIPKVVGDGPLAEIEFNYGPVWHNVTNFVLGDFNGWEIGAGSQAGVPFIPYRSREARHGSQYLLYTECPGWSIGRYTTNPHAPMLNNGMGGFNNLLVLR